MEPFGGAASILLRNTRSYAEIYNDMDDDVVNLFEILRSDESDKLVEMLRLTPFSKAEFERAYQISDIPIERARKLVIRSYMGFRSSGHRNRFQA